MVSRDGTRAKVPPDGTRGRPRGGRRGGGPGKDDMAGEFETGDCVCGGKRERPEKDEFREMGGEVETGDRVCGGVRGMPGGTAGMVDVVW